MDLQQLAMQVAKITQDAGRHAAQDQLTPHVLRTASPADEQKTKYSSDIDETVVRYLREKILEVNPLNGFWEEVGSERTPGAYYWCIGHIDGSINYMRNMPEWTITVSVFSIGEDGSATPVIGVVHAPALNVTYVAAAGHGAIRIRRSVIGEKREAIMPTTTPRLKGSVISFGMSYFSRESMRALNTVSALAGLPSDIKRVGPASLDLCKVADGTYDAYFEPSLHSWDVPAVSAATVVVWEAQGRLCQWDKAPISWYETNDVVACNGLIFDELSGYLLENMPEDAQ
ncbi:inositol monophosphatase [Alloscardovia macacae]|uniref:Inositol monophosphatase n=1 Tax=Alloscardovia macacae TaxID=1160091 RepID=A0A1Y2SZW5_9BIFI|nr:inositol monophosphatase family protein [Alloscardovia macacae]OTA26995.1 inositol monophosphatase [Alloscardovia macacae]OTA30017.1 inositol monophosphatase [Alloscardovia macacae]